MSKIFDSIKITEETRFFVDQIFEELKRRYTMKKAFVIKPVGGFGYHTGDEGLFPEDRIEALEKGGFIRAIPEELETIKEAKTRLSKPKK
tara:strand:- start:341 stop:610 length:270 start_codon:yes stop_codon:yes gene_type:complete